MSRTRCAPSAAPRHLPRTRVRRVVASLAPAAKPPGMTAYDPALPRHDWTLADVEALFALPFTELVFQAAAVHRRWFDPSEVQLSQLLSVKTGGCAENCGYCSQSSHFDTGLALRHPIELDRLRIIAHRIITIANVQ